MPEPVAVVPLVALLTSESEVTQQYAAAALRSLARDHTENQIALAKGPHTLLSPPQFCSALRKVATASGPSMKPTIV